MPKKELKFNKPCKPSKLADELQAQGIKLTLNGKEQGAIVRGLGGANLSLPTSIEIVYDSSPTNDIKVGLAVQSHTP